VGDVEGRENQRGGREEKMGACIRN